MITTHTKTTIVICNETILQIPSFFEKCEKLSSDIDIILFITEKQEEGQIVIIVILVEYCNQRYSSTFLLNRTNTIFDSSKIK